MKCLPLAALGAFVIIGQANAANYTGNEWLKECLSNSSRDQMSCLMYARGVVDGYMVAQGLVATARNLCVPDEVTAQQLVDIGTRYLHHYPEKQRLNAITLLLLAFYKAWPCSN
jgi:hypothetical protein